MLALSVKQPWAELLVAGQKTMEIRTWMAPYGVVGLRVAIHAGLQPAPGTPPNVRAAARFMLEREGRLGGIVGTARLVDRVRFHTRDLFEQHAAEHLNPVESWHADMVGFTFAEPVRFEHIIPCPGQLRFFELSEDVLRAVERALLAVGTD